MTVHQVLETVATLSNDEKFELVEAVLQMLRESVATSQQAAIGTTQSIEVAEVIAPYRTDDAVARMRKLIIELDNRPNPRSEQMLTYGLFKGQLNITDEDMRAAEWHPTDAEMDGE